MLSLRDEERQHRNMLKHHQVELVEEWQVSNKQIIFVRIKFSNSSKIPLTYLQLIFEKNPYACAFHQRRLATRHRSSFLRMQCVGRVHE